MPPCRKFCGLPKRGKVIVPFKQEVVRNRFKVVTKPEDSTRSSKISNDRGRKPSQSWFGYPLGFRK
jgi:hypothetical protein